MIVDIVFFSLLIIGVVIGVFLRNPIMCGIHLLLYVGFTYGLYFFLVAVMPGILNAFNVSLESLGPEIVSYLETINTELSGVGNALGYDAYLFSGIYLDDAYYNAVVSGALSYVCFIASALVSFLLAYGIAWAIYAIIKKCAFKGRDIFENKKWLKRLLGGIVTSIHMLLFLTLAISPYYQIGGRGHEVSSTLHYMGNKENLDDSYDDIKLLLLEADNMISETEATKGELDEMMNYIDETLKEVDSLKTESSEMEVTLNDYKARCNALINNPKVTSTEKSHLRDAVSEIDDVLEAINTAQEEAVNMEEQYMDEIDNIKNQYNTFITSFEAAKDEIEEYDAYCSRLESTFDTLESAGDSVNKYLVNFSNNSILSGLFNLDLGYSSASSINLLDEYEKIMAEFNHLYEENVSQINASMEGLYQDGKASIDAMKEQLDDLNVQIDENKAKFEEYKEDIDFALEEGNAAIEEARTRIDELDQELTDLENKYN